MDELNDGDAERPEADARPLGEFGSQFGAIGLGQTFAPLGVARPGVPWTTVLPEPGWLQKLGVGLNPSNAIGAALDRFQQRTFDLAPVIGLANEIGSTVSARLTAIGEPFRKMAEDMAAIAKSFEKYPDEMREGLIAMNQCGWYLDLEMGMSKPLRFKRALDDGRQEDAEVEMVKHFDKRTANIRAELIQAYPHRSEILDAAFDAHLNGQHYVSIPVLLAQVDGICFDVANAHFFMGKERPKVLAYATELAGTELARAFLAPLESGMTVALSEKARPQGFSGLNRHMVLHGESTDYGTKENGLRAISLLNYISQSLQRELSAPDESVAETERTPMPPIDS
ncbi:MULTISPECIES: hypothetical protein [Burkholderia]|jgi:hypothetical protein|uniref:Uncharacterized protein n=4 Tax=Burkholderia TaxID=32008 RepID=A0A250LDH6_9BURK|nr:MULTISPECIES: hypothetical protein [Burkholderia]MBH9690805.1 hypothetical protein [Burkholderia contaminans]MBK1904339.1 hypothetical protein [Burkholderia contaminans]MBK1912480.1 hypothetical protein [Burkholderia contaminans]MBK1926763.1 hypothetical protein [Burkholderia contaminans]MBK1934340.1 hypothetical protein [Burkholderia contaminans]